MTEYEINSVANHLIQTYDKGGSIDGYRLLSVDLDIDEKIYREILIALECYGLVEIKLNHTVLIADSIVTDAKVIEKLFRSKLKSDSELQKLVGLVGASCEVGNKIPSENNLKKLLGWKKQKVREKILRLQYSGYVECKLRVGRFLIKKLPDLK